MTPLISCIFYVLLVPLASRESEPSGVPPTLQFVKWNDSGSFEYKVVVTKYVAVERAIERNVGGNIQNQKIVDRVPTFITETRSMDGKNIDVYDLDGKKVEAPVWQKILGDGAVVVFTQDGNLPHPGYRKVFKAGTLVLVTKSGMPPPIPAPVPKTPAP